METKAIVQLRGADSGQRFKVRLGRRAPGIEGCASFIRPRNNGNFCLRILRLRVFLKPLSPNHSLASPLAPQESRRDSKKGCGQHQPHVFSITRSASHTHFAFAHLAFAGLSLHHFLASPLARVPSRPQLQMTSTFPVVTDASLSISSSGRLQNHWFFCLRTLPPINLKARRNVPYERWT